MTATMIRPGLYRVTGCGIDQTVVAAHGCDAIAYLIGRVFHE